MAEKSLSQFKVVELKFLARALGDKTGGTKNELICRLQGMDKERLQEAIRELNAGDDEDDGDNSALTKQVSELNCVIQQLQTQLAAVTKKAAETNLQVPMVTSTTPLPHTQTASTTQVTCASQLQGALPLGASCYENLVQSQEAPPVSGPYTPQLHTTQRVGANYWEYVSQPYGTVPPTAQMTLTPQSYATLPLGRRQFEHGAQPYAVLPSGATRVIYAPQPSVALPIGVQRNEFCMQSQVTLPSSNTQVIYAPQSHAALSSSASRHDYIPQSYTSLPSNYSHSPIIQQTRPVGPTSTTTPILTTMVHGPQPGPTSTQSLHTPSERRVGHGYNQIVAILPEFNPSKDEYTSLQFIRRIEQLRSVYGWEDTLLVFAVLSKLRGAAKRWADAQQVFHTWAEFVSSFLEDFTYTSSAADVHIRLMNIKIEKGEQVVDYCYGVMAIARREAIDDKSICRYIINGLVDEHVRTTLNAMSFNKCSDLLQSLHNIGEKYPKNNNHYQHNYQNRSARRCDSASLANYKNNETKYHTEGDKISYPDAKRYAEVNKSNQGPICFNCRQRGHISRNCPKPQRKERVNAINSEMQACSAENLSENSNVNIIKQNKAPLELIKKIKLVGDEEVKCDALIDSGSSKSLVKRSLVETHGFKKSVCCERLSGFAGGELVCSEKIYVRVGFDDVMYDAELLVVGDETLKYEVLVGIDILSKGTIIIDKGKCTILPIGNVSVDIGQDASEAAVTELKETLNNYSHCFGEQLQDIGRSKNFKMSISLTTNRPIVKKPYPIPIPKQQVVKNIIDELLEVDIIRHSRSLYASPIVLVQKQNGEGRLCVDFRELNSITEKQPWLMPTVEGVMGVLKGKRVFTTLDLMSGYYQLELEESSKAYTAFVTHCGQYEFNRMPFGLRNAPCAFQRMMTELISPLGVNVVNYVDEVIIATDSEKENIRYLVELLKLIEVEGLTLRLTKCSFMKSSVSFLGHVIDVQGIRPGLIKTRAIQNYPVPRNAIEIRRFIGLAGFFRKFVPNFSIIARPLTNLTRNAEPFLWTTECSEAFNTLINTLSHGPVLCLYDVMKEHQLHTDASSVGIAAILLQKEGNNWCPVAYYSRACNSSEKNYHAYELEVLAVVEACDRFKMYLIGKTFTIVTDCKAIPSAKITKPMLPRVARWLLRLLEFDYVVVHRPGDSMRHVDAISRATVNNEVGVEDVSTKILIIDNADWVSSLQRQDPDIKQKIDVLNGTLQSDQRKHMLNNYRIQHNRLFKVSHEKALLLVVPKGIRWRVVQMCHDGVGHPGVDGTIKRIQQSFYFPRMRNFVKGFIKSCIECSYHRYAPKKECELFGMEIPKLPFHTLHMDHLGPFVKSNHGNEYILAIVDALTRYSIITPVKTTKTKPVLDTLAHLTLSFGLPQVIVTDRGTAFTSGAFEMWCNDNDIKHIKVAVRTPRANGLAERVNKSVLDYLKTTVDDERKWDNHIRPLQWALNTRVNATTKSAPIDLIFDFPLRDISGNKLLLAIQDDVHVAMNQRREEAASKILEAREKWKKRFDAKHAKPTKYDEGDLVLLEAPQAATGQSRKLHPMFKGPYVVKKCLRFDRYIVEDSEHWGSKRKFSTVAASDKMKPWCSLVPELDSDDEAAGDSNDDLD